MKKLTHKLKKKFVGANFVRLYFEGITENKNGITLIALIITIVVMLILVGVTVRFTIGENGILSQTKEAKKEYEIGQLKEIFASNYSLEYYQKTGYWPSDEAITKIAEASIETGVDVNKFIVYHDKFAIAQNETNKDDANYEKMKEEFVFYNWNKVTLEEMEKLEVEYIPTQPESDTLCNLTNRCFSIDADGDGYLTLEDVNEVEKIINLGETNYEQQKYDLLANVCFDINKNNTVYKVLQEYWGCDPDFNLYLRQMFLWKINHEYYWTQLEDAGNFYLIIDPPQSPRPGEIQGFNYLLDNHIYYNSERVPLEQEVTE